MKTKFDENKLKKKYIIVGIVIGILIGFFIFYLLSSLGIIRPFGMMGGFRPDMPMQGMSGGALE